MAKAIPVMFRMLDAGQSIGFYNKAFAMDVAERFGFEMLALVDLRNRENGFGTELTVNKDREQPHDLGDAYGHAAFAVDNPDFEPSAFARSAPYLRRLRSSTKRAA